MIFVCADAISFLPQLVQRSFISFTWLLVGHTDGQVVLTKKDTDDVRYHLKY